MNDLKFKAWDKEKKIMVTDFVLAPTSPTWGAFPIEHSEKLEEYQKIIRDKIGIIDTDDKFNTLGFVSSDYTLTDWANYYGLENYIILQYIGLKDKNGKEIFEGDIVQLLDIKNYKVLLRTEVKWSKQGLNFNIWPEHDENKVWEIIGNIYENPELVDRITND